MSHIFGAVLTGGQSRRMGRPKALLQIDRIPLVERTAATLSEYCESVVAVGPPGLCASVDAVPDLFPGEGPFGGVLSALEACPQHCAAALIVACDLAALTTATIAQIIHRWSVDAPQVAAVARTARLEPLCAIWNVTALPALREIFAGGERSLTAAIAQLCIVEVDVDPDALFNVNTPSEFRLVSRSSLHGHGNQ